jgi:major membrane immunogen (membrane-anchored lipoprotein)
VASNTEMMVMCAVLLEEGGQLSDRMEDALGDGGYQLCSSDDQHCEMKQITTLRVQFPSAGSHARQQWVELDGIVCPT